MIWRRILFAKIKSFLFFLVGGMPQRSYQSGHGCYHFDCFFFQTTTNQQTNTVQIPSAKQTTRSHRARAYWPWAILFLSDLFKLVNSAIYGWKHSVGAAIRLLQKCNWTQSVRKGIGNRVDCKTVSFQNILQSFCTKLAYLLRSACVAIAISTRLNGKLTLSLLLTFRLNTI